MPNFAFNVGQYIGGTSAVNRGYINKRGNRFAGSEFVRSQPLGSLDRVTCHTDACQGVLERKELETIASASMPNNQVDTSLVCSCLLLVNTRHENPAYQECSFLLRATLHSFPTERNFESTETETPKERVSLCSVHYIKQINIS